MAEPNSRNDIFWWGGGWSGQRMVMVPIYLKMGLFLSTFRVWKLKVIPLKKGFYMKLVIFLGSQWVRILQKQSHIKRIA